LKGSALTNLGILKNCQRKPDMTGKVERLIILCLNVRIYGEHFIQGR